MNVLAATQHLAGPHIDWRALSPFVVLTAGALVVLLVGLLRPALSASASSRRSRSSPSCARSAPRSGLSTTTPITAMGASA